MVKHIILWQLKEEFSPEQKAEIRAGIKEHLEALVGKVPGLLEVSVHIDPLETSNADVMLDCTLESKEALEAMPYTRIMWRRRIPMCGLTLPAESAWILKPDGRSYEQSTENRHGNRRGQHPRYPRLRRSSGRFPNMAES